MLHGALCQRLGCGRAVLCQNMLFQRAAVHADADGDVPLTASRHHGAHPFRVPDVARVDADFICARLGAADGKTVVEVNVRDQGEIGDLFPNHTKGAHGIGIGHRHAHDVASGALQGAYLCHGRLDIRGLCVGHGLHRNRGIAAHRDPADLYGLWFSAIFVIVHAM